MQIALHIGAHKTASTFIQGALARNDAWLAGQGIRAVDTLTFRRQVTAKLGKTGPNRGQQHRAAMAALGSIFDDSGAARLILSDENLLGSPERLEQERVLYGAPSRKLAPLAEALAPHNVTVFLAVRTLAEFTGSILLECFRTGRYAPEIPDGYARDWRDQTRGWADVVAEIAALFDGAEIVVWNHWRVFHHMDEVLCQLCGVAGLDGFDMTGVPRRPSPSAAAVAAFLDGGDPGEREGRLRALAGAAQAFPRSPDHPAFSLWSPEDATHWQDRFRADLARIRAMGPQVRLLSWEG